MSYKYYKIKICNWEKYENIFFEISDFAYKINCLGIEELNIDEAEVDKLLGDKAFVSGEVGADVLSTIDQSKNEFFVYFDSNINTQSFDEKLKNLKCIFTLIEDIEEMDWNLKWKESYKPINIGNHLIIYPSWFKDQKKMSDEKYIYIYPGMGFGTGTHETTYLCLELLYKLNIQKNKYSSCLDLGCGSGILGVVVQKYFNLNTVYCDVDQDALENTKQNLSINDLKNKNVLLRNKLKQGSYSLVFANIILSELINEKKFISESVSSNGILILSGILNEQVAEIKNCYNNLNFICEMKKNNWSCLAFSK